MGMATRLFDYETIVSDLPGIIICVHIEAMSLVREGDELMLLESMKMEIPVLAHRDGQVDTVSVRTGMFVTRDQELARFLPVNHV